MEKFGSIPFHGGSLVLTRERLRDGRRVRLRPIRPGDGSLLRAGFAELSEESRQRRFFAPVRELSDEVVRRLTHVDGRDHVALVAVSEDGRRGLGVARFVRSASDPSRAELAVTVIDALQRRGLGRLLVERLARLARDAGIRTFTVDVLTDNTRVRRILHGLGAEWLGRDGDVAHHALPVTAFLPVRRGFFRMSA